MTYGLLEMKQMLNDALAASGITKAELARRMGIPKQSVNRIFNENHSTAVDTIELAMKAMGKKMAFRIE